MVPASADEGDASRQYTRRAALATGAALLAGSAGVAGRASAQQVTGYGLIPEPERWTNENLAGFIIHLGPTLEPGTPGDVPSNCEDQDWPPETISVYDGMLVNRKEGDTPEESTNLLVDAESEFRPGQLFLINTFDQCEGGNYVAVELEQIGYAVEGTATGPVADVEEDQRPNEDTTEGGEGSGAMGPGFDLFGAVAAATGLGGWLAWRRQRERSR